MPAALVSLALIEVRPARAERLHPTRDRASMVGKVEPKDDECRFDAPHHLLLDVWRRANPLVGISGE